MTQKPKYIVCVVCDGEGKTVNPDIDSNGLSPSDFHDDPGFAEDYKSGVFDITCRGCNGLRVITQERVEELQQNAEDRRLAARENGDFEAYCGAGDYRYG